MDTQRIMDQLRKSPFRFTAASKFRDELKAMDEDRRQNVIRQLRIEKAREEDVEVKKMIDEILFNL